MLLHSVPYSCKDTFNNSLQSNRILNKELPPHPEIVKIKHLSNIAGTLVGGDLQSSTKYFSNPVNLCSLTDSY